MIKIVPGPSHRLYGVAETRQIEQFAQGSLPANTLMQRAGLAVAQLAMAITPHARRIWVACGPGNNGGDGLEAAFQLKQFGKHATVTWLGKPGNVSPDSETAYQRALDAGIAFTAEPQGEFDLCIDALLGIGARSREPQGQMADWIRLINASRVPVLSVDVPSGLNADTGGATQLHIKATHTLSLLTLKPGLFTAHGRDAAGTVWLDQLGINATNLNGRHAVARLLAKPTVHMRSHDSHKGTYGDVAVVGGASGMTGAALLAASAALHAGAGRVFVGLLDYSALNVSVQQPELMFRSVNMLDFSAMTVVCGCGGGDAVNTTILKVLLALSPIVIDADAINSIANDIQLQAALIARSKRLEATVLTPHPLEAARLLGTTAFAVQQDRLAAAQALSRRFGCTVILKGSGTVIASPDQVPMINLTGNARLATAGTGDVLAGMVGARLAANMSAFDSACHAVYQHGKIADQWPITSPLTASQLARFSSNAL